MRETLAQSKFFTDMKIRNVYGTPGAHPILTSLFPAQSVNDDLFLVLSVPEAIHQIAPLAPHGEGALLCLSAQEYIRSIAELAACSGISNRLMIWVFEDGNNELAVLGEDLRGLTAFLHLPFWEINGEKDFVQGYLDLKAIWGRIACPGVWIWSESPLSQIGWLQKMLHSELPLIEVKAIPSPPAFLEQEVKEQLRMLSYCFDACSGNMIAGQGKIGILFCGSLDFWRQHNSIELAEVKVCYLANQFPLPEKLLLSFLNGLEVVLIVEGMSSVVEGQLCRLIANSGMPLTVQTLSSACKGDVRLAQGQVKEFCQDPYALPKVQSILDIDTFIGCWSD